LGRQGKPISKFKIEKGGVCWRKKNAPTPIGTMEMGHHWRGKTAPSKKEVDKKKLSKSGARRAEGGQVEAMAAPEVRALAKISRGYQNRAGGREV